MKKIATLIFSVTCISVIAIAQPAGVRIGNMEVIVRKYEQDTAVYINVLDCPKCPQESGTRRARNTLTQRYFSDGFTGIGFILPDNSSGYYSVLGASSINIDIGQMRRYHLSRRFALGATTQYSFYNYKLTANEPAFLEEVIGNIAKNDIRKQVYRSHNFAAGAFTRFYLIPPQLRTVKTTVAIGKISNTKTTGINGMFIDLGAQGDLAFSKYCKIKTHSSGKEKYRDGHAFNPFSASAIARIGWGSKAIFARYRLTDAFNQKALPMDLPPVTIGIQFF